MSHTASISRPLPRLKLSLRQVQLRWLIALAVACGAIVVFFPFFWMAVTSLKTAPEIQRVPLQIAPDHWLNFNNYFEVFKREPFLRYLLNSTIVASISAVSSVVVSSLAGFGFAKYDFPGIDTWQIQIRRATRRRRCSPPRSLRRWRCSAGSARRARA